MSDRGEGPLKIKVVDRRRFDDSGEVRTDLPPPERKPVSPPPRDTRDPGQPTASPGTEATGPIAESRAAAETSPLFLDLIAGLAQQAEILIVGGQGVQAQPAEAQRVIEYLAMLESKTNGNLSTEESQVLSNVIYQLRALYVQHTT